MKTKYTKAQEHCLYLLEAARLAAAVSSDMKPGRRADRRDLQAVVREAAASLRQAARERRRW